MGEFEGNTPVYLQVVDKFHIYIVSGKLQPGDQIPPVRKLAAEWSVNPNTIQKALQVLEQEQIAVAHVGRGRFVTEDIAILTEIRTKLLDEEYGAFYEKMQQYGLTKTEIIANLQTYLAKNKNGRKQ